MAGKVIWYEDENGRRPVQEFLADLDNEKHVAKIKAWILFLHEQGVTLGDPYTSQVRGRLRELKADFGKLSYRIFYYWDMNQDLVLLHSFLKKTSALTARDIHVGLQRMKHDMIVKGKGGYRNGSH